MKHIEKRHCISIALVTIVLILLCAGCASPLVNAAGGDSATNVRSPAFVGAPVTGAPAACAQGSNSLDLFVKAPTTPSGGTAGMGQPGRAGRPSAAALTSSPAATSPGNGLIDVFVRGTDNALWERKTTNGGSTWSSWYQDRRADPRRHRSFRVRAECKQPRRLCTGHRPHPLL